MLVHSIKLDNVFSYGGENGPIELQDLNILIGPNDCGKGNIIRAIIKLITAFEILQCNGPVVYPEKIQLKDCVYRNVNKDSVSKIELVVENRSGTKIRYVLEFVRENDDTVIPELRIEDVCSGQVRYQFRGLTQEQTDNNKAYQQNVQWFKTLLPDTEVEVVREMYPRVTDENVRKELKALCDFDVSMYFQNEKYCHNTIKTNTNIYTDKSLKEKILTTMYSLCSDIGDYTMKVSSVPVDGNDICDKHMHTSNTMFLKGDSLIKFETLSWVIRRYFTLVVQLCNPNPAKLVYIENPECGLHPDSLLPLVGLMEEYSYHGQLIVKTHSDILLDVLSDKPESILIVEKVNSSTRVERLNPNKLTPWLEKYELGQLWMRGELGGTRW